MDTVQTTDSAERVEPAQQEEPLPEFPRLTGPLGQLVEAITPDIPYEHKALSVLTYVGLAISGRTQLAAPYRHLQPRFYACLVGGPSVAKTAAQKEVSKALSELRKIRVERSINSGPALVDALAEHQRLLYVPGELRGAFDKAKHGKIFDSFLDLYEENEISHRVKGKKPTELTNVHFAMIGTATPKRFGNIWQGTGGGSDGLQSRFVLSFSEAAMPRVRNDNYEMLILDAALQLKDMLSTEQAEIRLPETVGDFTAGLTSNLTEDESRSIDQKYPRVLDMGRRFVLVLAACNGKSEIDHDTMKLGAAFIKYQIAVYDRLMPVDASSWVQDMENRMLSYFEKHAGAHTEREILNHIKPRESNGGAGTFKRALANLGSTHQIKQVGRNRSGFAIFELDD